MKTKKEQWPKALLLLLLVAFGMRLVLTVITEGYATDVSCFTAWAMRLADVGPGAFYDPDYFADYPPAYMLVLWGIGSVARFFHMDTAAKGFIVLLSLLPILCDLGIGVLVWRIADEFLDQERAIRLTAMALICPALLYDTAVWKQVDSVFALCILLVFWMLHRKQYLPAAAWFGLSLAIKPQALLFGPVLAVCFFAPLLRIKDKKEITAVLSKAVAGAGIAIGVVVATSLPFWGQQPAGWLLEKYTGTVSSYPYASVNAFNLITLLGGNWVKQTEWVMGMPITWQMLGVIGIVLATVTLLYLAWQSVQNRRFSPLLLAAVYSAMVFCLSHRMHERYLIPALLLILAAAAYCGDRRLLASFALLSFSTFLNLAIVLTSDGTDDQFLTSDSAKLMIFIISAINVLGTAWLVRTAVKICKGEKTVPYTLAENKSIIKLPAKQPNWNGRERLFVAGITLLVAVVSLNNLGDTSAPQTVQDAQQTSYTTQVQVEGKAQALWIYPEINWDGKLEVLDESGTVLVEQELNYSNVFHWLKVDVVPNTGYTIRLTNASVIELAFKDCDNQVLPVTGEGGNLFDEQDLVPPTISYRNSMYFDEIYHARTAYEHLHGMTVYETTHPPLGKVFIMLGIAVFGMTGFGWRVAGALFGVAMVPLLYFFVRRLTKKQHLAVFAAVLASFDLMRYAQSRIATIDVYGTFFILLGAYFMICYTQSVLQKGVCKSILPMALAGVAFGLGAASKWTGIYAGAGLAVLYFGVLWARWKQQQPNFKKEVITAFVGGVIFFVLVPLAIYIAAYFPYWWREGGFSLQEWWQCQISMYDYHSQLKSTHPFESRWYTWPFAIRPVWYYLASNLPAGLHGTISGMGNPIVWWSSTIAIGLLIWRQISGRADRIQGAVIVLYLTQLLPWVLVPRCTFMYHYFPSLWFAVVALAIMTSRIGKEHPKVGKRLRYGLMIAAGLVFIWFSPIVAGVPTLTSWVESTQWLSSWYY